jgi:hypothetical protein
MKKLLLLLLLNSLISDFLYSQIVFEKGYFIDNNNTITECFIKNIDWNNNPEGFFYTLVENGEIRKGSKEEIKEFKVEGYAKYIRANVKIDRSRSELSGLSTSSSPQWSDEVLYLKVLIEGKANLFVYESGTLFRLFYSKEESTIQQFVYKEYIRPDNSILKNNGFRQQLLNDLKLPNQTQHNFDNLTFSKKKIESIFLNYNKYYNPDKLQSSNKLSIKSLKSDINFKLSAGFNYSNFLLRGAEWDYGSHHDFGKVLNKRAGFEFEYIFPFNKNKWAVIIEPTLQQFKTDLSVEYGPLIKETIIVDCKYIEFPIGIRHYFFLNPKTSLYLTGYFVPELGTNLNSRISMSLTDRTLNFSPGNSLVFGGGISFYRFSADVRYYLKNNVLNETGKTTEFNRLYFIIGFRFLDIKGHAKLN